MVRFCSNLNIIFLFLFSTAKTNQNNRSKYIPHLIKKKNENLNRSYSAGQRDTHNQNHVYKITMFSLNSKWQSMFLTRLCEFVVIFFVYLIESLHSNDIRNERDTSCVLKFFSCFTDFLLYSIRSYFYIEIFFLFYFSSLLASQWNFTIFVHFNCIPNRIESNRMIKVEKKKTKI